ncbi:MAG: cysteine desulfurase NifS [Deltaproteobacteria bacterium HGW-Deltaproteobacteria-15]|jgi:cysteine desulfurase|nr:MAG: cysteine desulfurase NifS [Deltaproteobacteria bacterium HGW-Deltaproteobacteria-15]
MDREDFVRDIYFDNAATSPMRPEVLQSMSAFFTEICGNPSSLHMPGQRAKRAVEEARYTLAASLWAEPQEIVFTGGGTESNNLAIHGAAQTLRSRGRHIITSSIEHNAVLSVCRALEEDGFEVTYLPVDGSGILDVPSLRDAVRPDTILVSIMLANNEVGTIQPINEVASITRERSILLHTDACQAVGKIPVHVHDLGVDLLSLAAHKFHGPKGQGALFVKKGTRIKPLFQGGHQERMLRPGTENVPGIVGMAAAIRLALEDLDSDSVRVRRLRDLLERGVQERVSGVSFNGHGEKRVPQISNMSFASVDGEALLLALDMRGISVSTGSACNAGSTEPSHVLRAMGLDPGIARGGLRFSLGRQNTDVEVNAVIEALAEIVPQLRTL